MARTKNYEALIIAKEEELNKAKEKLSELEKELKGLKEEQKALEVSKLYEAVKKSGYSVEEVMQFLENK